MSIRNKLLIEVRQDGRIAAEWQTNAVPRVGEKVIVGNKAFNVKDVYWSRDHKDHYDAWVQVLIETEGREL